MKALLKKVKWHKGKTDTGLAYDFTRIFVEIPIYEQSPNEFGVDVAEFDIGLASDHAKLLPYKGKLPVLVDIEYELVKKGKNEVKRVTSFNVLPEKEQAKA